MTSAPEVGGTRAVGQGQAGYIGKHFGHRAGAGRLGKKDRKIWKKEICVGRGGTRHHILYYNNTHTERRRRQIPKEGQQTNSNSNDTYKINEVGRLATYLVRCGGVCICLPLLPPTPSSQVVVHIHIHNTNILHQYKCR